MARIPEFRYISPEIFGDSEWHHVADVGQLNLSFRNPLAFHVGDSTLSTLYTGATKIKSSWLWRYGFASGNGTNFWSTSTGSNGTTPPNSWGVGVTSGTYYTISEGSTVSEGYVTSGSNGDQLVVMTSVNFSTYNDWYFSPSVIAPSAARRAIVCRFKADYIADLPVDMYSISENSVTWNTNHPVYFLLQGKECIPY